MPRPRRCLPALALATRRADTDSRPDAAATAYASAPDSDRTAAPPSRRSTSPIPMARAPTAHDGRPCG